MECEIIKTNYRDKCLRSDKKNKKNKLDTKINVNNECIELKKTYDLCFKSDKIMCYPSER